MQQLPFTSRVCGPHQPTREGLPGPPPAALGHAPEPGPGGSEAELSRRPDWRWTFEGHVVWLQGQSSGGRASETPFGLTAH